MHLGRGAIAPAILALALTAPASAAAPAVAPAPEPEAIEVGPLQDPPAVEEPTPVPGSESPPPKRQLTPIAEPDAADEDEPVASAAAEDFSVDIVDFLFKPKTIKIGVGDTVTWTNLDDAPHDATADDDSFATKTLDKDQSESVTFEEEGSFGYYCSIHPPEDFPNFVGTVRVKAADSDGGSTDADTDTTPVQEIDTGAPVTSTASGSAEKLPDTGVDVIPLILIAAGLLASGLLARAVVEHLNWR